jgi:hypothetical protein
MDSKPLHIHARRRAKHCLPAANKQNVDGWENPGHDDNQQSSFKPQAFNARWPKRAAW